MNLTFEPELDQPTPRRVAAREGCGYGCGLWGARLFALPHTLAGAFLLYQALRTIVLYLGLLLSGTEVEGHITHKAEHSGKKGPYYTADYLFAVDGVEYPGQTQVTADEFAALREGQPIRVRVWAAAPDGGHSWDGSGAGSPSVVGSACLAALLWNGLVSVLVWFLYVRPWRRRWLERNGMATAGVVRAVAVFQEGKGQGYKIRYEYAVPAGPRTPGGRHTGSAKAPHTPEGPGVNVGDVITVLYDPRRPWRNVAYRFADHKAVLPAAP